VHFNILGAETPRLNLEKGSFVRFFAVFVVIFCLKLLGIHSASTSQPAVGVLLCLLAFLSFGLLILANKKTNDRR